MKKKKCNPFKKNKYEICYHLLNCLIASSLVLVGSLADGKLSSESFIFAGVAGLIVFLTKFKEYWDGQKTEYSIKVFNFVQF